MPLFSRFRKDKGDKSSRPPECTDSQAPAEERSGLFILHDCSRNEKQAIDIVAVHGLGGHWKSTWTGASDKLWLRDFLPNQLSEAGIKSRTMSFGYDSRTIFTKAVTDIDDAAAMLLDRIDGERQSTEEKERPSILIAHSLGGIVVKKAMILAHERSSYYGHLLAFIKAVVFFGVPHRGADLAFWLEFPARLLEYGQLGFGGNPAYVSALKRNSTAFASISDSFIERGSHLIIRTFYETEKMGNQLIVDKDSARLRLPNEIAVGVADSNHKMMCKFDNAESQKYRPIWVSIRGIAQDILKGESKSDVKEGRVSAPLQIEPNFVGRRQEIPPRVEGKFHAPRDRRDFEIALICALPLEAECVQEVFDKFWEDEGKKYGKASGDPNVYTTGVIGEHNVVLAYMPGMGTTGAAAVAGSLRVSFPNIKLALVVGICGGMPDGTDQGEIVLGDIIISQALIQYDLGRQYPGGFKRKTDVRDTLGRPRPEIRALQAKLGTRRYRQKLQNNIAVFLAEIQQKLPQTKYPGPENNILYRSSYVHQHRPPATCDECGKDDEICELALKTECEELGCESIMRVTRDRLMSTSTTQPMVHFGLMGSGNTVMKSGQHRDRVAQADGIVGFEMEGAGVWDYFPSIVIKGVCDHADSHKGKGWQRYAAAAAAACTKAFLVEWSGEDATTSSAPQNPHWLVPFGRNRDFVGRRAIMDRLLEIVPPDVDKDSCQRTAIEGLGGVGKTQMALEAAFRVRDQHPNCSVFWVPAVDITSLENAYREIGQKLQVAGIGEDGADVKSLVRNAMGQESSGSWLLIIDNADDVELLFGTTALCDHLPSSPQGSILFTTRNHEVVAELDVPQRNIITAAEMTDADAIEMLRTNLKESQTRDSDSTTALLELLTHLPLAIKQASAYMAKTGMSTTKYLQHCRSSDKRLIMLLSRETEYQGRYKGTNSAIATTWLVSFNHILRDKPLAADMLRTICFLIEKDIPLSLFSQGNDELEVDEAVGILQAYAFITEREDGLSFDVHRLVQLAMRNWLQEAGQQKDWIKNTIQRLADVFPSPVHENRDVWRQYLPHALIAIQFQEHDVEEQANMNLLFKMAGSHALLGKYREAEQMYRQTLDLKEKVLGEEHPDTLASMNNLAEVLRQQGKYEEAEQMHRQTLDLKEKVLGEEHPDTLDSMNNLALVLHDQGKYEEAEQMQRQAP